MDFIPLLIKRLRSREGLTMEGLAKRAGVSKPIISKIENGDTGSRLSTLEKIFGALDYPLWRAFMIEYMPEVIPAVLRSVSERFQSGAWRRIPGQQENKAEVEEKLADFVLREIDGLLAGKLAELPRLPDRPDEDLALATSRWSRADRALLLEEVTTKLVPENLPALLEVVGAMAKMNSGGRA
jgi:transcriptional regulator with XRE-family HTH domain